METTLDAKYYITKQFIAGADIWVVRLNDTDAVYSYDTEQAATEAIPLVQPLYGDRVLKVQFLFSAGL